MCEVGSFCGCISLYKGCFIIGFVSIVAGMIQVLIFSVILFESYDSSPSASTVNKTVVNEDDSSFYSFSTSLCPFGFIPLAKTIRNDTTLPVMAIEYGNSSSANLSFPVLSVEDLTGITNGTYNGYGTTLLNTSIETTKISCLAPTQGVLLALVIASCLYTPVGIILMIGVRNGATCLLSTWFFYTVAYNLLALIVALTDGVYTGAADVSSYLVCLVTAYCIIVVDSYYEKLLRNERVESTSRARPSLVVVKSSSADGLSPEEPPVCTTPTGKHVSLPPGYATACEVNELLLPSTAYNKDTSPA